jgi:hypothetical protein
VLHFLSSTFASIFNSAWSSVTSDSALPLRIAIGGATLSALALHDLVRNGRRATRWREYAFLVASMGLAMVYGIANDSLTSRISWEYFYYGKGLFETMGPTVPPDAAALALAAAKIGMKATWTAGAIIGVAILLANNPRRDRPQLGYRELLAMLPRMLLFVVPCAAMLGAAGYFGWLTWISSDFRGIVHDDLFRPRRFLCVFGIHSGAYLGGVIGIIWAVRRVIRRRRELLNQPRSVAARSMVTFDG